MSGESWECEKCHYELLCCDCAHNGGCQQCGEGCARCVMEQQCCEEELCKSCRLDHAVSLLPCGHKGCPICSKESCDLCDRGCPQCVKLLTCCGKMHCQECQMQHPKVTKLPCGHKGCSRHVGCNKCAKKAAAKEKQAAEKRHKQALETEKLACAQNESADAELACP